MSVYVGYLYNLPGRSPLELRGKSRPFIIGLIEIEVRELLLDFQKITAEEWSEIGRP